MGVILGLYMGFRRVLEESCGGCGSLLEVGLGKCSGEGPTEGVEGRLKGLGGLSITGLAGEIRVLKLTLKEPLCSTFLC